jgi:hypothetical protein
MVEQDMGLDAALGATELGPGKHRQAQRDGGRVQRQEFVLEAELVLSAAERLLLAPAEAGRSGPEKFLKQGGGAVLIGIGLDCPPLGSV